MKKAALFPSLMLTGALLFAQSPPYDLEDLFSLALGGNPSLERLRGESDRAAAGEEKARAARGPLVSGLLSYSYLAFPQEGITVAAGDLGTIPGIGALPAGDIVFMDDLGNNYYQLGLTLNQSLYTWGKLDLAVGAAGAQKELQARTLSLEERKIRTELETLLTSLAVLDRTGEHLAIQEETAPRLTRIVRESYDKGFLLKTDVLEAEMLSREIALARTELTQRRGEIFRRLESLTGLGEVTDDLLSYAYPGDVWAGEDSLPDGEILWQRILEGNGELRQLEAGTEALNYLSRIGERQKSHLPDLGFQLDLKYGADTLPFGEEEWYRGNVTATATLALKGNIYDSGRDRHDWEESRGEERAARARYEEALSSLRESLESERNALELQKQRILYGDVEIRKIREEREIKRSLWQAGAEGEEEYLKKVLEEESASIDRLSRILLYFQSLYALEYLTGGKL